MECPDRTAITLDNGTGIVAKSEPSHEPEMSRWMRSVYEEAIWGGNSEK